MKRSFPLCPACRHFTRAEAEEMAWPNIRFPSADHWDLPELKAQGGPQTSDGTVAKGCPMNSLKPYLRYAGLGVMSYNLHVIGRELLARERRDRACGAPLALAA